ncbi:hypothetical protein [Heyndrickxia camelliae]|uniref:Uncharacterized protein n=1 Tax=Heyndrickxia camelliae TaxID=1707093 RepID=A0A2N3LCV5_9BACI|nr:hypothetical protein [Heyndrickxia camelliae]PKR82458.1 hypothetical protein CWO92_24275 [Heyndrickxia camelliae]
MEYEHYEKLNYDHIVVEVNKFADPPISFQLHPIEQDGKYFVLIRVPEFDEVPIVCKKSGEQGKAQYFQDQKLNLNQLLSEVNQK